MFQTNDGSIFLTLDFLEGQLLDIVILLELFFGSLSEALSKQVSSRVLINIFWALDFSILSCGDRNVLQEKLLGVFADNCGIDYADD